MKVYTSTQSRMRTLIGLRKMHVLKLRRNVVNVGRAIGLPIKCTKVLFY
jgi:hypothetical protein